MNLPSTFPPLPYGIPLLVETYKAVSSEHSTQSVILALIGTLLGFLYVFRKVSASRKGSLPPGPCGIPFLGNFFQLSADVWVPFTEWKEKYGWTNTLLIS